MRSFVHIFQKPFQGLRPYHGENTGSRPSETAQKSKESLLHPNAVVPTCYWKCRVLAYSHTPSHCHWRLASRSRQKSVHRSRLPWSVKSVWQCFARSPATYSPTDRNKWHSSTIVLQRPWRRKAENYCKLKKSSFFTCNKGALSLVTSFRTSTLLTYHVLPPSWKWNCPIVCGRHDIVLKKTISER